MSKPIHVIDSHTEGEPTRVVLSGWPELRGRTMVERRAELRERFDHLRSGVVCEPRGHDALVGALLTDPVEADSAAGVIFFNNVGYLGMCGHGLIGVVRTLAHLGRLAPGAVRIDTPAGTVGATLDDDGAVTITNVPSYAYRLDVTVQVPGIGTVTGDVAYGGNWFYIVHLPEYPLELHNVEALTRVSLAIQRALRAAGITGADGAEIDHVEIGGPAHHEGADSRNFVLCPGGEYDRSPCGTGTSARMAVLHERGELALEQRWRQESVTGGLFTGWLTMDDEGRLIPHIRGRAWVTGTATLNFAADDPFRDGFTPLSR